MICEGKGGRGAHTRIFLRASNDVKGDIRRYGIGGRVVGTGGGDDSGAVDAAGDEGGGDEVGEEKEQEGLGSGREHAWYFGRKRRRDRGGG